MATGIENMAELEKYAYGEVMPWNISSEPSLDLMRAH
jgi:hypothetical protein